MKRRHLIRILAFGLSILMLLCGCDSLDSKPDVSASGDPLPGESESAPQEEKPTDYSKYNSYLHLADSMEEVLDILDVYFANVEFAEEFALVEGGDYAAIKDAAQFYISNTYYVREAIDYVSDDPSYPDVDAAVRAMGDSPLELIEAVGKLASYLRFDDFEEDNMAQAPEIHAAIWEPLQIFMECYNDFIYALDELADQTRGADLESMLQSGEMILYYSNVMIYSGQDILDGIWAQYEAAAMEADPNGEFSLAEIDMTGLSPLFDQFNSAYDGLIGAMEDEKEQEKVFTGPLVENTMELYRTKVDSLYARMGALAQVLLEGGDYSTAYNNASDALSSMISGYNSII